MELDIIYNSLLRGDLTLVYRNKAKLNAIAKLLLDKENLTNEDKHQLEVLIKIGNITYNNLSYDTSNRRRSV